MLCNRFPLVLAERKKKVAALRLYVNAAPRRAENGPDYTSNACHPAQPTSPATRIKREYANFGLFCFGALAALLSLWHGCHRKWVFGLCFLLLYFCCCCCFVSFRCFGFYCSFAPESHPWHAKTRQVCGRTSRARVFGAMYGVSERERGGEERK